MSKKKAAQKQIEKLINDNSIDSETNPLSDLGHSYSYENNDEKKVDDS